MGTIGRMVAAAATCALIAGCGSHVQEGTTVLHWYAAPDDANLQNLAEACSRASGGRYLIRLSELPENVEERRQALVRRLLAHDDSADIVSVDSSLTAELGAAKVLAPVPADRVKSLTAGDFPQATAASSYAGELVTVPWWLDPYLLWARGSVAQRIGLSAHAPITWSQLILRAGQSKLNLAIDGLAGSGLAAWVNALVRQGGGELIESGGRTPKVGLGAKAGVAAALVVSSYTAHGLGPGPSEDARQAFAGTHGGLLLAPSSAIIDTALVSVATDLRWAPYPVLDPDAKGGAPLVGMGLGVPLYARAPSLAYDAIGCLTDAQREATLMTSSGHSAARRSAYELAAVKTGYPLASVVEPAVLDGVLEPRTPLWHLVRRGIDQTWLPLGGVDASTPRQSARRIAALVAGSPG